MQTFSTSNFTGRISCKSEKFVFLIKSPESSLLPLPNHLLNKNSLVCQKLEMDVVCHAIYWNREPDISYKARDYAETDPTLLLQRNSSLFHHIPQFLQARQSAVSKGFQLLQDNCTWSFVTNSELHRHRTAELTMFESNSLVQSDFTSLHIDTTLFTRSKNCRVL